MRRRPGVAGLQTAAAVRGQYRSLGEDVAKQRQESLRQQLETFRGFLMDFAQKHKSDIRSNPAFRAQFHAMCAQCGVDPLASNKGFWNELLGFGDFYYELGVQLIETCMATRADNGGLINLEELRRLVAGKRRMPLDALSHDDCMRALATIKSLGGGFAVEKVGATHVVRSLPRELSTDQNDILRLAQACGCVTIADILSATSWQHGRINDALDALLKEGIAMVDDGDPDGQRRYWFPCFDIAAPTSL
ncbi:unnamed protein product [Closterium sp. NIES-64]|nr:unnamed protein product [Closterium sp. NIES-65]CAI5997616.1 unnamed protein product [Closterium sp. NIES-64]